ncbi:hypothetical protein [Nocardia farcinica]|nr:hypothetical protein [Nocardia farcinica]
MLVVPEFKVVDVVLAARRTEPHRGNWAVTHFLQTVLDFRLT